MSSLIPVQRTNKNGVTSRRWVRPDPAASNVSTSIPAPQADDRSQRQLDVMSVGRVLLQFAHQSSFASVLTRASDSEMRVLAEAFEQREDDYAFRDEIARLVSTEENLTAAVNYAVVYKPEIYSMQPSQLRKMLITEALNAAEEHCRTAGDSDDDWDEDDEEWNVAKEPEAVRQRTRDFVEAWCVVSEGNDLMHPYEDVMARVIHQEKDDAEAVISVLRQHPKSTVAQIDFMLEGGLPAISDGAL